MQVSMMIFYDTEVCMICYISLMFDPKGGVGGLVSVCLQTPYQMAASAASFV